MMKRLFFVLIAISALALAPAHFMASDFVSGSGTEILAAACSVHGCESGAHSQMPPSDCLEHCLKNSAGTAGTAVSIFGSGLAYLMLAAVLVIGFLAMARGALQNRPNYISKLFLKQRLRGVILIN